MASNEENNNLETKNTENSSDRSEKYLKTEAKDEMIDREEYEPSWFKNLMDCF